ncbi:hypothetical protein AB4874_08455 [Thioclava sp. 15-R06ZXC-3]|uniref:Uncharacterized protein n=1 Tax=Thioclava arctica TaxID=3238301 RepID=A0ABV3TJF0_9RHOB
MQVSMPAFIVLYDELHSQQREQLFHDASVFGNSINSGHKRLIALNQQIQAENC